MIKLSELLEYQKEHNLTPSAKLVINVNNRGRVPFINVGPQSGVTLPFMRVHGLVAMGYNVDLVTEAVDVTNASEAVVEAPATLVAAAEAVAPEAPVEEAAEAVVEAPEAEEASEAVAPEAPVEEAAEAVVEDQAEFTPFTKEELFAMSEADLKAILDGAGVAYSVPKKNVKSFLVNLILTEQSK